MWIKLDENNKVQQAINYTPNPELLIGFIEVDTSDEVVGKIYDANLSEFLDGGMTEAEVRQKRNDLLSSTDWWASSDLTMTQAQIDYRQSLRDITDQSGFPNVTWPTKPE